MSLPALIVVARGKSAIVKLEQSSLQGAANIRDFLEQTGDYEDVSVFQLCSVNGPLKEWVRLNDVDR